MMLEVFYFCLYTDDFFFFFLFIIIVIPIWCLAIEKQKFLFMNFVPLSDITLEIINSHLMETQRRAINFQRSHCLSLEVKKNISKRRKYYEIDFSFAFFQG